MRIGRTLILGTICTLASLLVPAQSQALFHISVIDEVLASLDGDASQQFVEIKMLFAAQNLVSNAVVAAFDAQGVYVEDILIIPTDVPNGTNGARWIIATSEFQSAHSFSADFTMPARIPLGGGMICWGAPGVLPPKDPTSWDHTLPTNYVDCLAYGTYSGPSNRLIGTPTALVAERQLVRFFVSGFVRISRSRRASNPREGSGRTDSVDVWTNTGGEGGIVDRLRC
jgi:hypothetical protein